MRYLSFAMLSTFAIGAAFAAVSIHAGPGKSGPSPNRPVLVELFTSQGCSSCPPADQLLEKLDGEGGVVAISRPVTYWDRLGWKDTLARPANDGLQRRYAARGLPGSGVYTPEAVVQGRAATVGSDERDLHRLIASAARDASPVEIVRSGDRVAASRAQAGVELRFLAIARRASVAVGSGENSARRLTYSNVVLDEMVVPCAGDAPCTAAIPDGIADRRGADRWAAVLQDREGGTVRAVRWIGRTAK
ncbi:DUF1223 domain-containing protein [Sphingopyxis sp. PAMC25046]|uniref:DUF1223 domain-containing protein n=1 Tax=Sphingopyxis sp. PAMC25046 TaxID=2565556 RepID=UPI00109DE40D|nr:DUF1223 domain-containing protein [Sphingopyxis sp. PAMC25046]QCB55038.1 DUF1223 domain-containing protein [Sphingopyxis sp. PAMC25046]